MTRSIALLRSALAGGAILGALWAVPTASIAQQAVTLNGPSATATCTASAATIGTNSITITCAANPTTTGGTGPVTTATLSLGAASSGIDGTAGGNATMAVNCTGECTNVAISLGASGITGATVAPATMTFTSANPPAQQATVTVPAATAAGTGTVTLSVTAAGNATGTTPAVGGSTTSNFSVNVATAAGGTIGFATPFSQAQTNYASGSAPFTITGYRDSGTNAVSAQLVCTPDQGWAPTFSPSTVSWAAGVTGTQSITVNPGVLPVGVTSATVTCTFQNYTGGSSPGVTTSITMTATASSNPSNNCSTTASVTHDLITPVSPNTATRAYVGPVAGASTVAVKFSPTRFYAPAGTTQYAVNTVVSMPSVYGPPPPNNGVEMFISECPGDFTNKPATANPGTCGYYDQGQALTISTSTVANAPSWYCKLDPAKNYYLNFRFQNPNTPPASIATYSNGTGVPSPTCTGSCYVYVDLSYN